MNLTKEQILEEELSEDILEIIEQKDKPEELRYFKRYILDAMERYAQQQVKNLNIPAVSTSTFMKEKRGYKRELLGTRYDGWMERTEYKWQYTWSDGTKSIKYTYR